MLNDASAYIIFDLDTISPDAYFLIKCSHIQMEHQQSMSSNLLKFFTYRTFSICFHLVPLVCVFIILL